MRAVLRLGLAIAAAGLALGEAPALAQEAPAASTNAPAAEAIGPRELQNFNLQGTVTRSAEPAPAARSAPPTAARRAPVATSQSETGAVETTAARSRSAAERPAPATRTAPPEPAASRPVQRAQRNPGIEVPTTDSNPAAAPSPVLAAAPEFSDENEGATLAAEHKLPIWPWLLAAAALGAGAAFLFWRRTSREALAGGPRIDAFVASEAPPPAPLPRSTAPEPAPKAAPPAVPPNSIGLVSSRLRPWIEISIEPLRCIVEDNQVRFEFEVGLFNSGSAPARDILIEASMFNASAEQDREIGAFFGREAGKGERIAALGPLKRLDLRPQLAVARDQLRVLEAGGRKLFVPLIAFNAHYRWSGGPARTSAAYLLGRDTKAEKLAPFRLDLGPRIFRGLGARALPVAVRN